MFSVTFTNNSDSAFRHKCHTIHLHSKNQRLNKSIQTYILAWAVTLQKTSQLPSDINTNFFNKYSNPPPPPPKINKNKSTA